MSYCHIMSKDEFVTRMLADQEIRKEKRRRAWSDYVSYCKARRTRIDHKTYMKRKQGGGRG